MKKIFVIVLSLLVGYVQAQELTAAQKKRAGEKVYNLFAKYVDYSTLKDNDKGYAVSDSSIQRFSDLFEKDAKVFGEIMDTDTTDYIITRNEKGIQQYLNETKAFPKGLNAKTQRANITFNNLAQQQAKIVYERSVNAMTTSGKTYISKDTLVMAVKLSDDYNTAKISYISLLQGSISCLNCDKEPKPVVIAKPTTVTASVKPPKEKKEKPDNRCPNDDDCDGVNNLTDKCPGVKGTVATQGCPSSKVSVGLSVDLGIGAGLNSTGTADVSGNALGYDSDKNLSGDNLKLSDKIGLGINAGLTLDLLFTQKRNVGLSAGVMVAYSSAKSVAEGFKFEYKAHDRKSREFRRILTANKITEKVAFTNVNIPILITYQTPTDENKKVGFLLGIGPVINVYSAAKSKIDGTVDFEGVYTTTNGVLGYSAQKSGTDYLLTREAVDKTLTTNVETPFTDVSNYFDKHYNRGYYIGLDQQASGSGTVKYKIGGGGLVRLGMIYQASKAFAVKVGVYTLLTYSGHEATSTGFTPVTAADDFKKDGGIELNSLLNATTHAMNTQYGINIGIQYIFKH